MRTLLRSSFIRQFNTNRSDSTVARRIRIGLATLLVWGANMAHAGDPETGYRLLTEKAYLPADFDQAVFDRLWETWDAAPREAAATAEPMTRREMTMAHYGLSPRPGDPQRRPLQYVVSDTGQFSMNCFACHGGTVEGQT